MTKQEEIREGIVGFLCPHWLDRSCGLCSYYMQDNGFDQSSHKRKCTNPEVGKFLDYLHSQGVVIKVDKVHGETLARVFKLFDAVKHNEESHGKNTRLCPRCQLLRFLCALADEPIVAVEPLIEEKVKV